MTENTAATERLAVLTDSEIIVLNAARSILADFESRATNGRVAEASSRAENAIFRLLNTQHSYGGQRTMTEAQLHNGPLSSPEPVVRDPEAWAEVARAGHSVKA